MARHEDERYKGRRQGLNPIFAAHVGRFKYFSVMQRSARNVGRATSAMIHFMPETWVDALQKQTMNKGRRAISLGRCCIHLGKEIVF